MQNGKEKRNQQAELTATKSLMMMHASAAAAAQLRCEAAEEQVQFKEVSRGSCTKPLHNDLHRCGR